MKMTGIILALFALVLIGGVGFVAFADITVPQTDISKEIPHERLFK